MRQVKDLIRLLFDTSLRASGFNLDEPAQFSGASTAGSSWASSSTRAMRAGATTRTCLHWRRWWTRFHRRIELGLIIDEGDEGRGDDDDLPPLEEVVDAAHKATKVAELLRFNTSSFPSLARSRSP